MNLLRLLLCKLGIVRLVVLTDFDGEENLRVKRGASWASYPFAARWSHRKLFLLPGGKTSDRITDAWRDYPLQIRYNGSENEKGPQAESSQAIEN